MGADLTAINHADLIAQPGRHIDLRDFDPGLTCDFKNKNDARAKLSADIENLAALQDVFYAQGRFALLIIFQGMDASGKDGVIKHVMSGINPQGVNVYSFKTPSAEDLAHDFLWRSTRVLPERGRIGIFNRSYYEEVGVVRVHPRLRESENVPTDVGDSAFWKERFEDIVALETHLVRNGTLVLKFFLHVSKNEQRKRLLERIDSADKNWKFSLADIREREYWDRYGDVYGKMLTHTSSAVAPWYVIPADHKWFTRVAVADVIVERLTALGLAYPQLGEELTGLLASERLKLLDDSADPTDFVDVTE